MNESGEENAWIRKINGKPFEPGNKAAINRGPNKISTKVKESIVNFLEKNVDAIQDSFDELKPIEKLQFIANILPYALPKLSSVQSENNTKLSGGINIRWTEPGNRLLNPSDKSSNGELPSLQSGLQDNL